MSAFVRQLTVCIILILCCIFKLNHIFLFKQPMTQVALKDPLQNKTLSDNQLKQYQKSLRDLKAEVIAEDKDVCTRQTGKLKEFIRQLHQLKTKVQSMRVQCQSKTVKLGEDINALEKKLHGFKIGAKNAELEKNIRSKISVEQQEYVKNCQKRIQIADKIDYKKLQKMDIDERKSSANEVWKWAIVAIYVEPENKYYWPNFKEQVIDNQEGCEDFKNRLGKINAFNAKEEQKVKTAKFIEIYDKVKDSPQFKGFETEIDQIYQIAKLFNNSAEIGKKVRDYEKSIEESSKLNNKDDELLIQNRKECDALVQKHKLSEIYLKQLTAFEASLGSKLENYNKEVDLAETYTSEISNLSVSKFIAPVEGEKREHCECSIF